jgi:hypothetical protein
MKDSDEITGTVVVCTLETDPSPFANNVIGACHFCRRRVQHRPYVPTPNTLVCLWCFASRAENGDTFEVSKASLRELANYERRN